MPKPKQTLAKYHSIHPIGLGAMPLSISRRPAKAEAIQVLEAFLEAGGNYIDTADVYGLDDSDRGHNEKLIREALHELGSKNNVLVSTKGGATRPEGGWGLRGGHPHKLRSACEQSLLNLNVSCHSLYYLHGPDPDVPLAESIGELTLLQSEGKIENIGICNVDSDELRLAMQLTKLSAVQNRLNPFCKGDVKTGLIDLCKSHHITYVPYCPLGGWADHHALAKSELFNYFTEKYAVSSYVICLAWAMHVSDNILPIPGVDKKEQVFENFKALELQLSADDVEKIYHFPDLYSPKHIEK